MKNNNLLGFFITLLLFLTGKNAIAQLPVGSLHFPSSFPGQQLRSMNDIEGDNAGKVWVAFRTLGVLYYDGTNWTHYSASSSGGLLPTDTVSKLFLDPGGKLWMQTKHGLTSKDSSGYAFYSFPANITNATDILTLNDKVYVSSTSGIAVLDTINQSWQIIDTGNSLLPSDTVNSLFADQSGYIWIATNRGFASWNNNNVVPYTVNYHNDPHPNVSYVTVTPFDTILSMGSLIRKMGSDFINIDSLYFRVNCVDEWCDSSSFGKLEGRPSSPGSISKPIVNSAGEIYMVRTYSPTITTRIFSIKPNHELKFADLNTRLNFSLKSAFYRNDSIIYGGSLTDTILRICEPESNGNYNIIGDSLSMIFPDSFTFEIPASFVGGDKTGIAPNMISTMILNQGDLGFDPVSQIPYYNVPRYSGVNSIWNSAIWLGGYDQQGNLYVAAQTYRQMAHNDFLPGPLDTLGKADSAARAFFDHIWVTRRTDIDEFRYQFAMGNVLNGTFPVSQYILNWPAYYNNGAFPQKLAPFVDFNGDGLYNPYDGDYPDVKGEQMSWCVYNDDLNKTETNSPPMNVEIHASAYGYYCPSSQDALSKVIAYTTFYHYDLYNRSDRTYDSCYFGIWSQIDLGNSLDDYVGCNITNNTFYAYNADSVDVGTHGFGECPPVQNFTFLKGPPAISGDGVDNNHNKVVDESGEDLGMSGFMDYIGTNLVFCHDPSVSKDFYNYLSSKWMDGRPITYGGDGVSGLLGGVGGTNIPTTFMFPDTSNPAFQTPWTMSSGVLSPTDVQGLGSVGPFTWPPDSMVSFDVAYITGPNDLAQNHVLVRQLRELFRNGGIERYRKFSAPIIGPDTVANAGTIVSYTLPTTADNYIWTVTNGLIISGQGTNTVDVTWGTAGTGTITAEAFDTGASCERKQERTVTIGPPMVSDCDGELTVRLYPNPTRSVLQIESVCDTVSAIKVWSMSGQLIEERSFNGLYNASSLSTGVYVMEMLNNTGEAVVRKMFVKY